MKMLSRSIVLIILALAGSVETGSSAVAQSQSPVVGVNVVNPYRFSPADQDAMLSAIKSAGVHVIRASITPNDAGVAFAERAWQHGIAIEWMIYRFGGYDPFGQRPLSAADPEAFRSTFAPLLAQIEAKGISLAAFELGNEINLSGTNPEIPLAQGHAHQLSLEELNRSAEGQQVAKGFLQYLKMLAVLKDVRDHSQRDQHTPIMNAGLGTYDQDDGPLPRWAKGDIVSVNTTLRFMRAHGLDNLVDAYAVHVYPDGHGPGDPQAAAQRRARLSKYDLAECRPAGASEGKPCWVTEWGFNNSDANCPINDGERAALVREMIGDFRAYAHEGKLAGLLYFPWNSGPPPEPAAVGAIFRCGALTGAGRLAVASRLLQ